MVSALAPKLASGGFVPGGLQPIGEGLAELLQLGAIT